LRVGGVSRLAGLGGIQVVSGRIPARQEPQQADFWSEDEKFVLNFTGAAGVQLISTINAIPEPSTWAMMLIGFAGLGFAFRRSRHKVRLTA
jgi:hypothetical protein